MNNNKIKVAFLFGAGAEGRGNYNICNGFDFIKSAFFCKSDRMTYALKNYFNTNYFDGTYDYTKHQKIDKDLVLKNLIINKASNSNSFFQKHKSTIRLLLNSRFNDILIEKNYKKEEPKEINDKNNKFIAKIKIENLNNFKDSIYNDLNNVFSNDKITKKDIENEIVKDMFFDNNSDDKSKPKIDFNIALSTVLDSYFHTIISPAKYSKVNFSRIMNFYWNCYFIILEYILKYLNNNKFEKCFKKINGEIGLDYGYIIENLKEITEKLYSYDLQLSKGNTYYDFINEYLNRNKDTIKCQGVITTNYYRFCEIITKELNQNISPIYLNGQLKNFEFPETLDVLDLTQDKILKNKIFFPFIFGQSLVKPIVNSKQTEEFHNLYNLLLGKSSISANILVILGYNINEDDNHINSYLHEFLKEKNKKVILVTNKSNSDASAKLKSDPSKIIYCKVDYENENIKSKFKNEKEYYKYINENIVKQIFDTILENKK